MKMVFRYSALVKTAVWPDQVTVEPVFLFWSNRSLGVAESKTFALFVLFLY